MKIFVWAFFVWAAYLLSGCTKESKTDFPTLTLSAPTPGQMYNSGDTILIRGKASASASDDAHLLHDLMLEIKKLPDSSSLFNAYFTTHQMESFDFDTFYVANSSSAIIDAVVVARTQNHMAKVTTKTVSVMIHP